MKKQSLFILLISLIFSAVLFANSSFAPFGFGEVSLNKDVYSLGMGKTGVGNLFRINTSLLNPSVALTANNLKIVTAFTKKRVLTQTKEYGSFLNNKSYEFPYFNIIYPKNRNVYAFSFNSAYLANYTLEKDNSFNDYKTNIYKTGVVYGKSYPLFNAAIGFYNYGGSLNQTNRVTTSFLGKDSTYTNKLDFSDNSYGFNLGFSKMTNEFSFGGVFISPVVLENKIKNSIFITDTSNVNTSSINQSDYKIKLPALYFFGATYQLRRNLLLSIDFGYEVWKSSDFIKTANNSSSIFFGVDYESNRLAEKWYLKLPLRGGFYYKRLPFEVNNNSVNEVGFTLGFSVPSKNKNNRIDISINLLKRGDKSKNLREDKSVNLSLGIMGFDILSAKKTLKGKRDIPKANRVYEDF